MSAARVERYRGYEVRITHAGVWWGKPGGQFRHAKNQAAALREIAKIAPPEHKLKMPEPVPDPVKYVSTGRAAWRAAYKIPDPESE